MSPGYKRNVFSEASGKTKVDFMITHRCKPEQTQQAFDMVAGYQDDVTKALIEL